MDTRKDEAVPFLSPEEDTTPSNKSKRTFTTRSCLVHLLVCCTYIAAVTLFAFSRTPYKVCLEKSTEAGNLDLYCKDLISCST